MEYKTCNNRKWLLKNNDEEKELVSKQLTVKGHKAKGGDYITESTYNKILVQEKNPMFRLTYRLMWDLKLRVGEVVGDERPRCRICGFPASTKIWKGPSEEWLSKHKNRRVAPRCQCKDPDIDYQSPNLPGIKKEDIDPVKPEEVGLHCNHIIRVYRKLGDFQFLPLLDDLYNAIMVYAKHRRLKDGKLFSTNRHYVHAKLTKYGKTIGGLKPIHPHSLRRGGGISYIAKGGQLAELKAVYNHSNLAMTFEYIGLSDLDALNAFASRIGANTNSHRHNNKKSMTELGKTNTS